jgi:hypothetical protein
MAILASGDSGGWRMGMPRNVIAGLWCLLVSASVSAQVRTGPFGPGRGQGVGGFATPVVGDQIGMIAIEPFEASRPVTGAPYTAEAVTETMQVLADGNRIERRTTASIARDSKGRIRREQQALVLGGLVVENQAPLVTITDPSVQSHVTLDQERRVAVRIRTTALTPVPTRGFNSADAKTEDLGERTIEGLRAQGSRTTRIIPAHAIGNQSPIITVSERWYSPDLQAVVVTERSDPRFGATVYRLAKIRRVEPPSQLFEVPAGYRIEEQTLPDPPPRPAPQRR